MMNVCEWKFALFQVHSSSKSYSMKYWVKKKNKKELAILLYANNKVLVPLKTFEKSQYLHFEIFHRLVYLLMLLIFEKFLAFTILFFFFMVEDKILLVLDKKAFWEAREPENSTLIPVWNTGQGEIVGFWKRKKMPSIVSGFVQIISLSSDSNCFSDWGKINDYEQYHNTPPVFIFVLQMFIIFLVVFHFF